MIVIRRNYPPVLSGDQLCRVCHISKRKAKWLLENGVIPYEDTGRKTHRYLIRLEDAIRYLKKKDRSPDAFIEPKGIFSSRPPTFTPLCDAEAARSLLTGLWAQEPDALTTERAVELTGYTDVTLRRWIRSGELTAVRYYNSYLIPKYTLIECMAFKSQQNPKFLSARHIELLEGQPQTDHALSADRKGDQRA